MITRVVNMRDEKFQIYIGRAGRGFSGEFGNPFVIGRDGNREAVIKKYKTWFLDKVESDMGFRQKILALRGKTLGCFCYPLPCHGSVIADWLNAQPENNTEKS